MHNTPIGAPVLVYRPEKDKRDGPYSLLDICGEDVTVPIPEGDAKFINMVLKPKLTHDSRTEIRTGESGPV